MSHKHPECTGTSKRLCPFDDCKKCFGLSFASSDKARFWSISNKLSPRSFFKCSRKSCKFVCSVCNHEFALALYSITSTGSWCPFCAGRNVCENKECESCNNKSFASNPKSKFWSDRNTIQPHQVSRCSGKKFWFWCDECDHEFEVRLDDCTIRGNWCSYCAGKKLCSNEECSVCLNRSFKSCPKSKFWSKLNSVDPRYVMKHSHTKYKFNCEECKHVFDIRLDRVNRGDWCSYCNGDMLCDSEDCDVCLERSFDSHYRAEFWSELNEIFPRNIRKSSNKKFWFTCDNCNHTFEGILSNIVQNDSWCPYCSSPPHKLCDDECQHCFNTSFASHPKAKYWSPLNKRSPRTVFKNAHTKYTFICDDCEFPFQATPNNITSGNWCPLCKHKTEKKLYQWLCTQYPDYTITRQKSFPWCINPKTNKKLSFDFYIPEIDVIIELDGPQHFTQIHNWEPPEEGRKRDTYKEITATSQGITLIRALQEDVLRDHGEWEKNLRDSMVERMNGTVYLIYDGNIEYVSYHGD
jgi:very-short-patch-repair endonuclease